MKKQLIAGMAIALTLASCKKDEPYVVNNSNGSNTGEVVATNASAHKKMVEELKNYAPSAETKTVNSNEMISLTTEQGNIITFPNNAFVNGTGNPIEGDVDISVTEITNISDMIFSGMMTNSDEGPLSSQGEFNIEVTKDGEKVFLDDETTFTIENPSAEKDEEMIGWSWIPSSEDSKTSSTSSGEWIQNGIIENNLCSTYINLMDELFLMDPNTTAEGWSDISPFKDLVFTELAKNFDISGDSVRLDFSWWLSDVGNKRLIFESSHDSWFYELNYGSVHLFGDKGNASEEDVDTTRWYGSHIIDLIPHECRFRYSSPEGFTEVNLDPNAINVRFNELNWCNIDRLLSEYGRINNCRLISDIPDFAQVICIFKDFNGAIQCNLNSDKEFYANSLPVGYDVQFFVYYKDGDQIKCGSQVITPAEEMEFDPGNLKTLNNVEELAEEIKKITE